MLSSIGCLSGSPCRSQGRSAPTAAGSWPGGRTSHLISWIVLRGRCRICGLSISLRYPAVELATGLAFALVAWAWRGTLPAAGYCCLAAIDDRHPARRGLRSPCSPGHGGNRDRTRPALLRGGRHLGERTGGRSSARWPGRSLVWPSSPSFDSSTRRLVTLARPAGAPCSSRLLARRNGGGPGRRCRRGRSAGTYTLCAAGRLGVQPTTGRG